MTAIIEGFYKEGRIDLREIPPGWPEGPVRVIVTAVGRPKPQSRYLTFGKYRPGRMSNLEDFQDAEWHSEIV